MKAQVQAAGVVLGAVVVTAVLYSVILEAARAPIGIRFQPVAEGVLVGAVSLCGWTVARTRAAAGLGLLLVGVFVFLGANAILPVESFVQAPVGSALATVLVVRLVAPEFGSGSARRVPPHEHEGSTASCP